jgi:hypothetical protein
MGKQKRPSIYVDRGTLGSSDELDEYGVWVKSEPHDLTSSGIDTGDMPDTGDIDFEVPDMDELPDFGSDDEESIQSIGEQDDLDMPLMDFDSQEESDQEESDSDVFNFGDFVDVNAVEEASDELEISDISDDSDFSIEEADLEVEASLDGDTDPETPSETGEEYTEVSMDDFIGAGDLEDDEFSADIDDDEDIFQDSEDESLTPESPFNSSAGTAQTERGSSVDLSTQLLMKIAEELSSIRTELSSLKKEFSGIKVAAKSSEKEEERIYGEDDEKIALTGDELNNILNTADFTEETGADVTIDLAENAAISPFDNALPDLSLETEDSLRIDDLESEDLGSIELNADDFEPDISSEADFESEISTDLETFEDLDITEEDIPSFTADGVEELSEIRETGVEPMTFPPAPEDSDYLAEDPMGEDQLMGDNFEMEEISLDSTDDFSDDLDLSEDSIDLSGAVIDEPDLSSEIHENPLEEPALEDISIDLDISELDSMDLDSEDLDSEDLDTIDFGSDEPDIVEPDFPDLESVDIGSAYSEPEELESPDLLLEPESQAGGDMSLIPEGFATDLEPEELEPVDLEPAELQLEDIESIDDAEPVFEEDEEALSDEDLEPVDIEELEEIEEADSVAAPPIAPPVAAKTGAAYTIPTHLKQELKTVLAYMDQLLEALPDDKIEEFARSEYYDTYKKLFKDLGLA